MKTKRAAVTAAAEQFIAGELALATSPVDVLAYLTSEETQAFARARFISDSVLDKTTAIVKAAADKEAARAAAEYAVAAALFPLGPVEAYNYLVAPKTLAMLRKADVSEKTIEASLAVVEAAAVAADPSFVPGKVPKAVQASSGSSSKSGPGAAIGGLIAALAAAGGAFYAQQQGLFDAATTAVDAASTVVDAASTMS